MSKYNKYINNFANNAEYEAYLNGSIAEVPNTALIDETGEIKMTKYLPNNYVMFGTTTGTQNFMIGQSSSQYSSADCIQIHVVVEDESGVNKMYVATEDVLKITKYLTSKANGFCNTEGNKIVSINKWKIDTSNVVSCHSMFENCKLLTSLDLSNFAKSNLTDMNRMFYKCSSLTSLDLSGFDVSNVTDISYMFSYCESLTSLDLSGFDVSNVTDMSYMLNSCSNLTTLNLSSFNTSKATNMSEIFQSCNKINKLYLSSGFFNSTSLTTYDFSHLSNWKDTETLAMFVEAITAHDGSGKKVYLSSNTKNALTTEQKTAITNAGWTIA